MAARRIVQLSVEQRRARGREARDRTPPDSHTGWAPATDRPDPVALLEEQNVTRERPHRCPGPDRRRALDGGVDRRRTRLSADDDAGFLELARGLRSPLLYETISTVRA
jgi:hypothetical protein